MNLHAVNRCVAPGFNVGFAEEDGTARAQTPQPCARVVKDPIDWQSS
jgi:hypothetical protein